MPTMDELAANVNALSTATTALLDSVNVRLVTLDDKVATATTKAALSTSNAALTTIHVSDAQAAASQTENLKTQLETVRDQTVALSTSNEGSVTPAANRYPISDANGHIDSGWTPMLAAMYTHSGVIGSVDKEGCHLLPHSCFK